MAVLTWAVAAFVSPEQASSQTADASGVIREPGFRLPAGHLRAVVPSRSGTQPFYAATDNGLFASNDAGHRWNRLPMTPLRQDDVLAMAAHPLDESHLFIGGRGGLWKSPDGGTSWKPLSTPAEARSAIRSIAVAPTVPEIIYIGTERDGVFRTSDGGGVWSRAARGLPEALAGGRVAPIRSLTVDPTNASIAYAGTELHGLYKTANGGTSWVAINRGLGLFPLPWRVGNPSIVINRADPRQMMVMLRRPLHSRLVKTFVYQTIDGGDRWFALEVEVPSDAQGISLVEDSADPKRIALLTTKGTLQLQWQSDTELEQTGPRP